MDSSTKDPFLLSPLELTPEQPTAYLIHPNQQSSVQNLNLIAIAYKQSQINSAWIVVQTLIQELSDLVGQEARTIKQQETKEAWNLPIIPTTPKLPEIPGLMRSRSAVEFLNAHSKFHWTEDRLKRVAVENGWRPEEAELDEKKANRIYFVLWSTKNSPGLSKSYTDVAIRYILENLDCCWKLSANTKKDKQ